MSLTLLQAHNQTIPLPLNKFEKIFAENFQKNFLLSEFQNNFNILQTKYANLQVLGKEREKIQLHLQSLKAFLWNQIASVENIEEKAAYLDLIQKLSFFENQNCNNIAEWNMLRQNYEMKFFQLQSNFFGNLNANLVLISNNSLLPVCFNFSANSAEALSQNNLVPEFNLQKENINISNTSFINCSAPKILASNKTNIICSNSTQTSNGSEAQETSKSSCIQASKFSYTRGSSSNKKQISKGKEAINHLFTKQFELACEIYPKKTIGSKSWEDRIKFILKFKLKKMERIHKRKISKKFLGRSKEAIKKLRLKGRFVKDLNRKKNVFKIKNN
jgi:hypothetical protein